MGRVAVGFGVSGDRAQPEGPAGALDAKGDLAAVGDEDGVEHRRSPEPQQRLAGLDLVARVDEHGFDSSGALGAHLVEDLHRLDDADGGVRPRRPAPTVTKRGLAGRRRQVDDPAERGADVGGDGIIGRLGASTGLARRAACRERRGVVHCRRRQSRRCGGRGAASSRPR